MKTLARKLAQNQFISSSALVLIGTNVYNASQFVYHSITGRFLGKALYGDLATIISILGLVGIVQLSVGLTIVKFIAQAKGKKVISNLIKWFDWWSVWAGAGMAVLLFIASPVLIKFLNIQQPIALYLLGPTMFFAILVTTHRSILQGLLRFDRYVFSFLADALVKIILTLVLAVAGFAAFGALGALMIGFVTGYIVSRISLALYLTGRRDKRPNIAPMLSYSFPVLVQGLSLTSMYSTDLILVKHFFSSEEAGLYASLAVLGRVVFFGVSPITNVMFPLVVQRYRDRKPYHNLLYISLFLVTVTSLGVVGVYMFVPQIPILILYGSEYLSGQSLLWWFGAFMGLLGAAMLLTQFYLSVGKTRVVWLFVVAAFLQIFLIWFIHSTILEVIQMSIIAAALLVLGLIVYFPYHHKKL